MLQYTIFQAKSDKILIILNEIKVSEFEKVLFQSTEVFRAWLADCKSLYHLGLIFRATVVLLYCDQITKYVNRSVVKLATICSRLGQESNPGPSRISYPIVFTKFFLDTLHHLVIRIRISRGLHSRLLVKKLWKKVNLWEENRS